MNLILTVLEIVAPVFLLASVGFTWVKLGFEYRIQFVTNLVMTLALPCLIFTSLMKTDIDPQVLASVSLATVAAYGLVTLLAFGVVRLAGLNIRTYLAPLIFGNTGNLGFPLALFAFGNEGLSYAVIVFAIMGIYSFTFGVWVVSGGGSVAKVIREPLVGATLLGALFLWQGWQTPRFLTNTLELAGQIVIPVMLITLGVALARLSPGKFGRAVWLSAGKALFCALIAWNVGQWFGLPPVALAVLTVQLSAPVAVTSYMLAEKYGAESDAVAGLVVVSTLISVVSLPLILGFVI